MADINIIRKWSDEDLIRELRSPARAKNPNVEGYMVIIAEALARILESLHFTSMISRAVLCGFIPV